MAPDTYTDVYNDLWLKRYTTSLIKRQWGQNLSKFAGVAMIGGLTLKVEEIYTQALQDQENLELEMKKSYQLNPAFMIG